METGRRDFAPASAAPPRPPLLTISCFLYAVFLLYGCASPGEPVERKPPTPGAIGDLTASQMGNEVTLAFSLPHDSLDKRPLQQPLTIEVYRDFQSAPAPAKPTLLVTIPPAMVDHYLAQGRVRFVDSLRAEDFGPSDGREVTYIVRTFVSPKKPSPNSNAATVTIYPAPDPISDLKADNSPSGVALSWTPPQKTNTGAAPRVALYRVYRAEAAADSGASATANPPSATAPENFKPKTPLSGIAEPPSSPYTDTQAELGKTYIYSVRSVSQYPGVPLESLDSNFASITAKDIFPPSAPQNVVVVFVPAAAGAPAHLEISWAINPETDVAGYNVYRSEEPANPGTRVDPELLLTPAFRDMNVVPGRPYVYTVTAVDRSGNESPASAPASGSVPAENQ